MRTFIPLLPALACSAMLFVCFRSMFGHKDKEEPQDTEAQIKELREEVARLRAEREPIDG